MNVKELIGRPEFTSSKFLGYIMWKLSDGFHLRWTLKGKKQLSFQGKIICADKIKIVKVHKQENAYKVNETQKNTLEWDTVLNSGIDGFDFLTPGDFEVELRIKNKIVKPKQIFLGSEMIQPENNPFKIEQPTSELIFREESTKYEKIRKRGEKEIETIPQKSPDESTTEKQINEDLAFEPAPLPIPAPEYEITQNVILPEEYNKEIAENLDMQKTISDDVNHEAKWETIVEIEQQEDVFFNGNVESEVNAEQRIYDWLNQLLNYRDSKPKIERKVISSYATLPESKPESFIKSGVKPDYQKQSINELESKTNQKDAMESRIYAWMAQIQQHRSFKTLEK